MFHYNYPMSTFISQYLSDFYETVNGSNLPVFHKKIWTLREIRQAPTRASASLLAGTYEGGIQAVNRRRE